MSGAGDPAELLRLYRSTCYDVRLPGGERTRLLVGNPIPIALLSWLDDDWPMAFISACNPRSIPASATENRIRMRAMLDAIDQTKSRRLAGAGYLPSQKWRESSLLVAGMSLEAIDRLAVGFGQNAIVIANHASQARLRLYRNEWREGPAEGRDIDWAPT